MSDPMIVTLFAGPGGTCTGVRWAGWDGRTVGVEWDAAACATARAAGHERLQGDVAELDPHQVADGAPVAGLVGTPPCPSFSTAGQGAGRRLLEILVAAIRDAARGRFDRRTVVRECTRQLFRIRTDTKPDASRRERLDWARRYAAMSALVVEPMRWAVALGPRWIVLEQVPPVLPLWQAMAVELRRMGYRVWCGVLDAEMYGVPQTRDRAILIADLDAAVGAPEPTHQQYRHGRDVQTEPDLFGDPLPPPVSMAEALGWGLPERPAWTVSGGGTDTGGAEVFANAGNRAALAEVVLQSSARRMRQDRTQPRAAGDPALTVAFGHSDMRWVSTGNNSHVTSREGSRAGEGGVQPYARPCDVPAPTVDTGVGSKWRVRHSYGTPSDDPKNGSHEIDPHDRPSPTVTGRADSWAVDRPATTVQGDSRVWPPGHKVNASDRERLGDDQAAERYGDRAGTEAVRVTVAEAGVLQSFPPDYPWQGTKTAQYRQVGDAVPPLLAMHVIRPRLAVARERAA